MNTEFDDILIDTDQYGQILRESMSSEHSDEILHLTPYDGGSTELSSIPTSYAEYHDINTAIISQQQQDEARSFVNKVEQFLINLDGGTKTPELIEYIKQVGTLQFGNLADIMTLVTINKQMITNIVARINATQAEDYPVIQSYISLVNQHIKLSRELMTVYNSIPSTIKKLCKEVTNADSEGGSDQIASAIITQDYGDKQFNNGKEMLKALIEKNKSVVGEA